MQNKQVEAIIKENIHEPISKIQSAITSVTGSSLSYDHVRKLRKRIQVSGMSPDSTFDKVGLDNNIPHDYRYGWVKSETASVFFAKEKTKESYLDIAEQIKSDIKKHSFSYKPIKRLKSKVEGNLLIIDPADVHIGKLSTVSETGESYDVMEAVDRTVSGVLEILDKAKPFNIDKIWLIIGNDILHIDTLHNTTTRGTKQDTDGLWHENFKVARMLYVKLIEELMLHADVHVIFNPSNHDYMSGYFLADSIESWFNKCKNVTFDTSIKHRKYAVYGENLIMTSHGDEAKESDYAYLMPNECPKEWYETKHRYVYLHHIHHKRNIKYLSGKDFNGITIEYLRSPSGTDAWHYRNGYCLAPKAVEGFIHSKTGGQIARITHIF